MRARGPWIAGAVVIALLGAVVAAGWLWTRPSIDVSSPVAPHVRSVIRAYQWSRVSGSYWENDFLAQSRAVRAFPPQQRVEFYGAVLIDCDFDTSRTILFVEELDADAPLLKALLERLQSGPQFERLTDRQRFIVTSWITELGVLSEVRGRTPK